MFIPLTKQLPLFSVRNAMLAFNADYTPDPASDQNRDHALMAVSEDEGRTFEGRTLIDYHEQTEFAAASHKRYYQYARTDGTSEVVVVANTRGETTVRFHADICKPIDGQPIEVGSIAWPRANERAIEQAFMVKNGKDVFYYVLTSVLSKWGDKERDVQLHYGSGGELYLCTDVITEQVAGSTSYQLAFRDVTLTIHRPQYDRMIPGKDETTSDKLKPTGKASTYRCDDGSTTNLIDVWDRRNKLFAYENNGVLETIDVIG